MSLTLYRKYRPQTFAGVIDQTHIKIALKNEIILNKVAHAYLFAGPRGIGKTTLARVFAKSINCLKQQDGEPCNQCEICNEIVNGSSLDLIEIDAASNRGINEIRELREQVKYAPSRNKYKVFIIDEVHMLTTEAFNALLKTLEEPPAHAIFILATTEVHQLPDTIISRCQRFDFHKVSFAEIVNHLEMIAAAEHIKVARKVIENVARISGGYVRDSISLLGQILALGEKEIDENEASLVLPHSDLRQVLDFVKLVLCQKAAEAVKLINLYHEEGGELENFTKETVELLRKILVAKTIGDWQELSWILEKEDLSPLIDIVATVTPHQLVEIVEVMLAALTNFKKTDIIQLPLEMAIVQISESVLKMNKD